jgi:hypothetical protein
MRRSRGRRISTLCSRVGPQCFRRVGAPARWRPPGRPATSATPALGLADLGDLALAALGIAFVSFAETSVLSRALAGPGRYRADPNRELIALGATRLLASSAGRPEIVARGGRVPDLAEPGSSCSGTPMRVPRIGPFSSR